MISLLKRTEPRIGESEVKMSALGQPPHVEEVVYQEPGEPPHLGLLLPALLDDLFSRLPALHIVGEDGRRPDDEGVEIVDQGKRGVGLNTICVEHPKAMPSSERNCS